jgi:hypothetical protein
MKGRKVNNTISESAVARRATHSTDCETLNFTHALRESHKKHVVLFIMTALKEVYSLYALFLPRWLKNGNSV